LSDGRWHQRQAIAHYVGSGWTSPRPTVDALLGDLAAFGEIARHGSRRGHIKIKNAWLSGC
jgi:hypothetical protein